MKKIKTTMSLHSSGLTLWRVATSMNAMPTFKTIGSDVITITRVHFPTFGWEVREEWPLTLINMN